MDKYCTHCGNQISPEEKFCKHCGKAIYESTETNNIKESENSDVTDNTYEFFVDKATLRFMSTTINTTVTVKNNVLSTSVKCKSRILSKKTLIGQVNVSDISSVKYNQYATIAVYDMVLFGSLLLAVAVDASDLIAYALLSGLVMWRTLIPSLEIAAKDNRKINILFSPQDNKKEMYKLVSQITGKEINENSDLKIPFSKKPFVTVLIYVIVGFIMAVVFD